MLSIKKIIFYFCNIQIMKINNYLSVIKAHKLLIKANINKLPDYFEHMYDNTDNELKDELTTYKKEGIINVKYYGLLESVAKFINKYDLDVSVVKYATLKLINDYHRIKSLNKTCFSDAEEVKCSEESEWNNQTQASDDETGYESEHSDEHEINTTTNKKPIITNNEHENDLRIILKQAIKNSNRELMITTMGLLKMFDESKSNTSTTEAPITNTKTPGWLIPLKCTVNPENNKKLNGQSFKFAIAASKTTGDKKFRLTNIEKHLNKFNFEGITYPPNINDYKTFENNNTSIKLIILKESSKEKRLCIKYNDTTKNDRSNKLFLIHLNSDHYLYVTKSEILTRKYIINTD